MSDGKREWIKYVIIKFISDSFALCKQVIM